MILLVLVYPVRPRRGDSLNAAQRIHPTVFLSILGRLAETRPYIGDIAFQYHLLLIVWVSGNFFHFSRLTVNQRASRTVVSVFLGISEPNRRNVMRDRKCGLLGTAMVLVYLVIGSAVIAEDQPPYAPLPALRLVDSPGGEVISCWRLGFRERVRVLFTGRIWVSLMCFTYDVTPSYLGTIMKEVFTHPDDNKKWINRFYCWIKWRFRKRVK